MKRTLCAGVTAAVCAAVLIFSGANAVAQQEDGLILHYTFDEALGNGRWLPDRSGREFKAWIGGNIQWVPEGNRKVLRFDGTTHLEVGKDVGLLIGKSGTLETWCFPEETQGGLISWGAGMDSPDQRLFLGFYTYQDNELAGGLGNGVDCTHRSLLHPLDKGKWAHLAMTFDGTLLHLFINGEEVKSITQAGITPKLQDVPLRIGWIVGLDETKFNFIGKMAEVRVYNRALSNAEIKQQYIAGVKTLGIETRRSVGVEPRFDARKAELTVLCDVSQLPVLQGKPTLSVVLRDAKQNVVQEESAPIPAKAESVPVAMATDKLVAGLYEASVSVKDADSGKELVAPATAKWFLPEIAQLAGAPAGRKVLNNMVTQLAATDDMALKEYQEVPFVNPRKGWVFVSATAPAGGNVVVGVDADTKETAIIRLAGDKPVSETMRLLGAGEHKLCIWSDAAGKGTLTHLVVRAVPAMMYTGWPGGSYAGLGTYDFAFLKKDVLPNLTSLVGAPGGSEEDRDEWRRQGRQSLQELPIPTRIPEVLKDVPIPLTGDYAYNYWINCPGFTKKNMDGAVNDEFGGGEDPDFPGYIDAVKRVAANPAFKDKTLYMWGGPTMALSKLSSQFVQAVIDCNYKIAWEDYLVEVPTVEAAKSLFDTSIRREMDTWERGFPGFSRHVVFTPMIASAPPWNADINPGVDYKVFLDMQFQHVAASPEFAGLWGILLYKATYADEEVIRWCGRLFRHYCIEGNTELLSDKYGMTYNLKHIQNPDFDDGLNGWEVAAAEPQSVTAGNMRGLHGLLNRYHGAEEGSNFLLMKLSTQKPNRVSQEISGLAAGQCYSLRMFAADHRDYVEARSEKKKMVLSVDFGNAEAIPAKTVVAEIMGYQAIAQFADKEPPYMTFYRLVFRAKGPTARLTISDWADEKTPGGPAGQEALMNFIQIQPYLED